MPKARFYLPFLLDLALFLSPLPLTVSVSQLQGLQMIQILQIRPHLDNASTTSSSQLLQDTLIV